MDDIKKVVAQGFDDKEYIHELGHAKRVLELCTMEPGFQEKFTADPEGAFREYHIDADPTSMKILAIKEEAEKVRQTPFEELPRTVRRYRAFMNEKFAGRDAMAKKECVPSHPAFKAWRGRQVSRCWAELGVRNSAIVHAPIMYELNLGCSVGCPFCGVAAGKLQKVFRYTEENAALWKDVLGITKEIVGSAGGSGICYYATEPLDNPEYEEFTYDYFDVFGIMPQITTATATRNIQRTKNYLKESDKRYLRVNRFSVLSLDMLHKIHAEFTPEELLYVELLPQFPEAPSCHFSNAGRAREFDSKSVDSNDQGGTISCISGFVVNMAESTIRLVTPCRSSDEFPTGERLIAKRPFGTAEEYRRTLAGLIEEFMPESLPKDQPLRLRNGIHFEATEEGIQFYRDEGFKLKFSGNDDIPAKQYQDVLAKLKKGGSAYDIAGELLEELDMEPANTFFILKKFEQAGLFLEPYE